MQPIVIQPVVIKPVIVILLWYRGYDNLVSKIHHPQRVIGLASIPYLNCKLEHAIHLTPINALEKYFN